MPRFYLRRFADDRNQLTRVPFGGSKPHLISTRDATVQNDFYRLPAREEGTSPDAFEDALSEVETQASAALGRLLDDKLWPITPEDRYRLASWIALQFLRSQATRTGGEEIARSMSKLQLGAATTEQLREELPFTAAMTDAEVEETRARMLSVADTRPVDAVGHLRLIAGSLKGATNLVYHRKPWVLVMWTRKALATSDTPVILVPDPQDRALGKGVGIGTAVELRMPLGRRAALAMGSLGGSDHDIRRAGNALLANSLNQNTLWNARREAFHHPEDQPFAGLDIPDVRKQEMGVPSGQIDHLIRAFAAQQGRAHGLPSDHTDGKE